MSDPTSHPATANPKPALPAEPRSGGRRHYWIWPLVAVLSIASAACNHSQKSSGGGGSGGGGRGGRSGAGGPVLISTAAAETGSMKVYVEALGIVTPVYTVSLEARVAGQITKVEYKEGQDVKVGDPLVEIDPRPYQAAVDQAQGLLEHDKSLLADAQIDLARYKAAYESNAIPEQQYRTQVATVEEDEGTVKQDTGNLESDQVNLDYCHITSPIDGRVGLRLVDPGNIVQANGTAPLVVITQVRPITVIFTVAEDDLPKVLAALHKQQDLVMDVYDREDQSKIATGTLETLDNEINPSTGTLKLRGVCSNEDESLFPNQFVNVHLLVNTLSNVTLVPNSAIQRNSESAYVYLVKPPGNGETNQTVQIQTITVGPTDGTNSVVNEFPAGSVIAADNFNRLTDGAKVSLRSSGERGQKKGHKEDSQ